MSQQAERIPMQINVITIFPEYYDSPLEASLIGKAIDRGLVRVRLVDPRDFAGSERRVDDYSYGGGPGMVMTPGPIFDAFESIEGAESGPVVALSASGRRFDQALAGELAEEAVITIVTGRYEGIDHRVSEHLCTLELSVGDFVVAGGDVGALAIIEAVTRLLPDVMGNAMSAESESFSPSSGGLLEYPQYTRPPVYRGWTVPDVLTSGDHGAVDTWRRRESLRRTALNRPDLLVADSLADDEVAWLRSEGLWEPPRRDDRNSD